MKAIGEVVSGVVMNADKNAPSAGSEYMGGDGLLHCALCDDPVQCRIRIFGEEHTVRCICGCVRAEMKAQKERERQEEIERHRRECFEGADMICWTFEVDDRKDERLTNAMQTYADGFGEFLKNGKGLLLYGRNGTGKTFYAACIANSLIDSGYRVLVTDFARLANQLSGLKNKQEFIDGLSVYDLVVFDDLGAERSSEYMQEIVFGFVNARCCSGLPFIVTTNLTIDEITKPQDFGRARIYSRILQRCFPVEVNGADRRKAQLRQSFPDMAKRLGL